MNDPSTPPRNQEMSQRTDVREAAPTPILLFGMFRFDARGGLFRAGKDGGWTQIPLGSRALDVLLVLLSARGDLVTKPALMEAVWPDSVVEDANLTVQISSLRRVLDSGRTGGSCIQTVVGRGYRILLPVTVETNPSELPPVDEDLPDVAPSVSVLPAAPRRPRALPLIAAFLAIGLGAGALTVWRPWGGQPISLAQAPRLSLVVLPFQNLSGDPADDYLADGITDDLTSDLSHIPEAFVVANASARTYKAKAVDARIIGQQLGVRYVIEGSVRRIDATLRVNVQLIAAETGAQVWSDRFDEPIASLAAGQDAILARMRGALGISLVEIETASAFRAPPIAPDAYDLLLRARALRNQLPSERRSMETMSLYEQVLRLDPSSVLAMAGLAGYLVDERADQSYWTSFEKLERAETLMARARELAPNAEEVLVPETYRLRVNASCQEAMAAARRLIDLFPNNRAGYNFLGWCKTATGNAEEEAPLLEKLIRLNPRDPYLFNRYRRMGYAAMLLGRNEEAITFLERSLALNPEARTITRHWSYRNLVAAHANAGHEAEARQAMIEADRLWPFDTVRSRWPDSLHPVYAAQIRRYQEGLRRAGERDHADEDADFGVPAENRLRVENAGYTSKTVRGAVTIRTADLPAFIAERRPVIMDALSYFWGRAIPGATGLRHAGLGGSFADAAQTRLGRKAAELSGGDLSKPIVAVGWNSERFDGHNLTIRLVALGYTNVHWYRGGREAWEAAGLPETELVPTEW